MKLAVMSEVLDEGRTSTGMSIEFHGDADQKKIALNFHPDHLSSSVGVANAGMMGIHRVSINNVENSTTGITSGLSIFKVVDGDAIPIESPSCGITTDTTTGAVYKHHVVLGTVQPGHPGCVEFSEAMGMTPDERLSAYKLGAARNKYNPLHGPREGIKKVTVEGSDESVYTTAVDGGSPLSILIKSNPQLNKTDKKGEAIFHQVGDVKHHVLDQESLDQAMTVLSKHLKPKGNEGQLQFELHTPNPPNYPYKVTVHGHIERGSFVSEGSPSEPADLPRIGKMVSGSVFGEEAIGGSGVTEGDVPGMPGVTGKFSVVSLEDAE